MYTKAGFQQMDILALLPHYPAHRQDLFAQATVSFLVIRVFPKWNGNSVISLNSVNRISQFKDPAFYTCLAGTFVAYFSLAQEVTCMNPFTVMTNIFVTELTEFNKKVQGKINCHKIYPNTMEKVYPVMQTRKQVLIFIITLVTIRMPQCTHFVLSLISSNTPPPQPLDPLMLTSNCHC